ncbi:Leucine-rich repeat (LRR) protein [Leclercia adecarboxylata]
MLSSLEFLHFPNQGLKSIFLFALYNIVFRSRTIIIYGFNMLTILAILIVGFGIRIYYVKSKIKAQHQKKVELEKEIRQHCYNIGLTSEQVTSISFDSTLMSKINDQSLRYTSHGGKWFGKTRANAVAILIKEHYDALESKQISMKLIKWATEFNLQQFGNLIHELDYKLNIHTIKPVTIKSIFALERLLTDLWGPLPPGKQLYLPEVIKDLPNLNTICYGSDNPGYRFHTPIKNDFKLLSQCKHIKNICIYYLPQFNPDWVFDLTHLEGIDLQGNCYKTIPEKIFLLPNLKELLIAENSDFDISLEIPDSISNCKNLSTINLFFGPELNNISNEILKLENLTEFQATMTEELLKSDIVSQLEQMITSRGGKFEVMKKNKIK